jgi:hypothetical protein
MPQEDRQSADAVSDDPPHCDASVTTPASDGPAVSPGGGEKRRVAVVALVERTLGPSMGLCLRVFDPLGDNPDGHEKARMIVTNCIARSAARGVTADDTGTRQVLARVAEAALDALAGHPGGAQPPRGVDLGRIAGTAAADEIAPSGYLRYAVLQDATAPARRSDRQVAFVVLAAGVTPGDAAVLLGTTTTAVDAALSRITHRIAESEGLDSMVGAL